MNQLFLPAFYETIFNQDNYNIVNDYLDVAIDKLFEIEVLKNIPIVQTTSAICTTGINMWDRHLLKETFKFIIGLNTQTITQERLEEHRYWLDKNPKEMQKEIERIMILCNGHLERNQSVRLGKAYQMYINKEINWIQFCELSEINRRILDIDIPILKKIKTSQITKYTYQIERLKSLGLAIDGGIYVDDDKALVINGLNYKLTFLGKQFLLIC